MAVFLTGDTHGELDIAKVDLFAKTAQGLTRDDHLIILGDFGLVWGNPPSEHEVVRLDWLESQPWTTLFIDGNHENFDLLDALPVTERYGGHVQDVRPHVTHLMRGETYEIGGYRFFVCGGAHSIDVEWRTPHRSWWPQEVPNERERERISAAAAQAGEVDYVLTHCPPTGQYERYRARWSGFWGPSDEWTDWLEKHVEGAFAYKRWFYGHLHFDTPDDVPYACLFNQIIRL
ncbi:MAG: metallophosphoesterase [Coriobacteriales bacterium]|nr:metallophosphoesterase [Coriobacteriales bacterium]